MKKKGRIIWRIVVTVLVLIAVILLILPTVAHLYIENKSKDLIGRKISIGDLDLNYATVTLSIDDFVFYEKNDIDPFVSFNKLRIDLEPWKLLHKEYALKEFFLDGIYVNVEFDGESYNFDDLIHSEADTLEADTTVVDTAGQEQKELVRFSFENIQILNGGYRVYDKAVNKAFTGKNINLQLPVIAWDNERSELGFHLDFGRQGSLDIDADVNHNTDEFWVEANIDSMQIRPLGEYLKNYMNTTDVKGTFFNSVKVHGSLSKPENMVISGNTRLSEFVLNDNQGDTVFKVDELYVQFDSIDVFNQFYYVEKVKLVNPEIKFIRLDSVRSNITEMMIPAETDSLETTNTDSVPEAPADSTDVAKVDTATYEEDSAVDMRYIVDSVLLVNGKLSFVDQSLERNFYYKIEDLNVNVTGVDNEADRIPASISMLLNGEGTLNMAFGFSLKNPDRLDADIELRKLDLVSFSPYTEYFISRPIHQGRMVYLGELKMSSEYLDLKNDFWIRELEFGERVKDSKRITAPVRVAMGLLKDKNDNVEMHVPVEGDPSDPDFDIGKIIWRTFTDFFVKIASKPNKMRPRLFGTNPNKIDKIEMELLQEKLSEKDQKTLEKIADIFEKEDKKESRKNKEIEKILFVITQETPVEEEKKALAVKKVCVDYMMKELKPGSATDSLETISKLMEERNNNSGLLNYINELPGLPDTLGFEDKCVAIVGEQKLSDQLNQLINKRNKEVEKYLFETLGVDKARIEVRTTDLLNFRPQYEFPIFRIESAVLMELKKED